MRTGCLLLNKGCCLIQMQLSPEKCLATESILLREARRVGTTLAATGHTGPAVHPLWHLWDCTQRHMEIPYTLPAHIPIQRVLYRARIAYMHRLDYS